MQLSVILIADNVTPQLSRTLTTLSRGYQLDARDLDYEILLVDNGSSVPPDAACWDGLDVPVRLITLPQAQPSPARAINAALDAATGETVCLMTDAAQLLTPGVFKLALAGNGAFESPVVAIRCFHLGADEHSISVPRGYDAQQEDEFLARIDWPSDGYRLFEVGIPQRDGAKRLTWFNRMFESPCLFMRRSLFHQLGGADERFDYRGGGLLNLDIFKRAVEAPAATPIQIVGEGCFRQLHGDSVENSNGAEWEQRLAQYKAQYQAIRPGEELLAAPGCVYMGHMSTVASNITARERRRARLAGKQLD